MRPQDLITVRYDHVQQTRIIKRALKRVKGLQRLVIVRRTQALEAVLDRLATRYRKEGVRTLLVNVDGSPWKYSQIDYQLRTLRRACSITRPNLKSGKPTEKHLHDFRGTFATRLFETTDFLDAEIARLLGWKESTVRLIRHMYVDERTRIVALGAQLQRRAEQLDARP
jgi:integrase